LFYEKICLSLQKNTGVHNPKANKKMKKLLPFFLKKSLLLFCGVCLVALSLVLTSCSDQRAVNRTANAFLQSFFIENDFNAAMEVSTRVTHENISMRAMRFHMNPNSPDLSFQHYQITGSEIRHTRATVFYTLDNEVERRLNLRNIDGHWFVDMPETVSLNPDFSLAPTHTHTSSAGFASAMSESVRLGDVPTDE